MKRLTGSSLWLAAAVVAAVAGCGVTDAVEPPVDLVRAPTTAASTGKPHMTLSDYVASLEQGVATLSDREAILAALVAGGPDNRTIADALTFTRKKSSRLRARLTFARQIRPPGGGVTAANCTDDGLPDECDGGGGGSGGGGRRGRVWSG